MKLYKRAGFIDSMSMHAGDSFFVPANYGEYTIKGDMEVILTEIPNH